MDTMIKFKNVHKHFKDLHVINGVNLEIKKGEVVVVCGPSGSGKSTLIRTVNQLESIESGEIWVDGVNVADPKTDLNKIREEVGFVFQSFNLYPHLTVLDNITLAPMKVKGQMRNRRRKRQWSFWNASDWHTKKTPSLPNFPAASSNAWRLRAGWRWSRA